MKAYLGGTFDIIHPGHIKLFRWAKETFGHVTVALNRTQFVERYKGKPPVMNYQERFIVLSAIRYVDSVIENFGDEDSKPAILSAGVDVIVNGSDWSEERLMRQMMLTDEFLTENSISIVIFKDSLSLHSRDIKERM